jgi:hypothetical protein
MAITVASLPSMVSKCVVLSYDTVLSGRVLPKFWMEILIPPSGYSTATVKITSVVTVSNCKRIIRTKISSTQPVYSHIQRGNMF